MIYNFVLLATVTVNLDLPVPPPSPILEMLLNETVWWVGTEYPYLPGPLSPTAHSKSRKWFIVTHGTQVGVFLDMYAFLSHCQYETYLVYQPFHYYLYARLFRC